MTGKTSGFGPLARLDLSRFAAAIAVIVSLVGVGVGAYLTTIKFRMSYAPCLSAYGGCQVGGLSCDDALDSSWSMLWGLPLSLWASAFYLVTAVLAGILVARRGAFGGTTAHLLLLLAVFSVLVSIVLATYTAVALPSPCPFCLSLYAISALLLTAAYVTRDPPGIRSPSYGEVVRRRLADLLDVAFIAALVLVMATGVQSMVYHGLRNKFDAQTGCPETGATLPATALKLGAAEPAAIIALFIDMSCHKCRQEFKVLANALQDGKFTDPVQLWIYHTPRHACDSSAFRHGYRKTDDGARFDNACLAARAVECMEILRPGHGFELIGGLFALQDDREKDTPLFTAERIGNRAVKNGMDIDPDDAHNPLYRCIDEDASVLARITEHQMFVEDTEFKVPTVAIYHAVQGAPDPARKPLFGDARTPLEVVVEYVGQQAAPEAQP